MEEAIINALKKFGLTDYEARVYYATCISEKSSATELSKISKVPRARIYDILSTLARKGWVKIVEEKPTRYLPVNFTVIKKKLEEEENKLKKAKNTILEEIQAYSEKEEQAISEAAQELVMSKEKVMELIKKYISTAKSEIMFDYISTSLLENLIPILTQIKMKNIKLRIILNSKQRVPNLRTLKKLGEIRRGPVEEPEHGGLLVDRKYYMNIFEEEKEINAVILYYTKCILCISAWLNRIWEESKII